MRQLITGIKNRNKTIDIIYAILLLCVVIFTYKGLIQTYFRQDEWASLGQVLSAGPFNFFTQLSISDIVFGKLRPLGTAVNNVFHHFFPFSILPFVLFGIIVHWINGFLVYRLAKRMSGSYMVGFITSVVFACSYTIHQAITWFAAPTTTVGGAVFLLLSLSVFFEYLEGKLKNGLWLGIVFLYIATLFKESNMIGVAVLPLMYFLYSDKKNRHLLHVLIPFGVYLILLLVARVPSLLGSEGKVTGFTTNSSSLVPKLIAHVVTYPVTAFAQQFIPQPILFRLAAWYQSLNYAFLSSTIKQSAILENITSDMISLLSSFYLYSIALLVVLFGQKARKHILFGILFSLISYVPYAMLDRGSSLLDSRYFYVGMIGGAFAFANIVEGLLSFTKKIVTVHRILLVVTCITIVTYAYKQSIFVQRDIRALQFDASVQTKLLKQIHSLYPKLNSTSIFYITGNRMYYGVENLHIPFQAGPGYMLMVTYYPLGNVPRELLHEGYLLDVRHEGYRAIGNNGFGYYSSYESLQKAYTEKLFDLNGLHALYYDGNAYEVKDITAPVKEALLLNRTLSY